ncbi:MAG: response regulator [Deltaproteobacteria bacterium]|nr:response regulator [Deltaproteobacteria bacterium]
MVIEPAYEQIEKSAESIKQPKALVMDDEELIRNVVRLMLRELAYDVSLSKDGNEAIEQYKNSKASGVAFDVVILDLNVKEGMGGKEACRRLLEIDPSVICIASSGYPDDPVITEFEKYGFKGSVAKPYSIYGLGEVLQEVITGYIK